MKLSLSCSLQLFSPSQAVLLLLLVQRNSSRHQKPVYNCAEEIESLQYTRGTALGHQINGFVCLSLKKEEGKKALTGARETIQSPLWPWRRLEKLTFTGDKLEGKYEFRLIPREGFNSDSDGVLIDFRDTPLRYLGYANEVGEAFRALMHVRFL